MRERDLAASRRFCSRGVSRRKLAFAFHQRHEQLGQPQRLGAHRRHRRLQRDVDPHLQRGERQDRRRSHHRARDAACGPIGAFERERLGMAEPAGQRQPQIILQMLRDMQKCRRARAAVQIFVATAHREIDAVRIKLQRHRADGMRQVPQHQRTRRMRRARQCRHVMHRTAAVVHMRQHQHGSPIIERRHDIAHRAQHMPALQQRRETLRHVEIGRKVAFLGQDHVPARPLIQRRGQQLEQIDRGGVRDHRRARRGADQSGDLLADAELQIDPAVIGPAADQRLAPLAAPAPAPRVPALPSAAGRANCRRDRSRHPAARTDRGTLPARPRDPVPRRRRASAQSSFCSTTPAIVPPSTTSVWPVTKLPAGDARNTAAPAISSGSPMRCSGLSRVVLR